MALPPSKARTEGAVKHPHALAGLLFMCQAASHERSLHSQLQISPPSPDKRRRQPDFSENAQKMQPECARSSLYSGWSPMRERIISRSWVLVLTQP